MGRWVLAYDRVERGGGSQWEKRLWCVLFWRLGTHYRFLGGLVNWVDARDVRQLDTRGSRSPGFVDTFDLFLAIPRTECYYAIEGSLLEISSHGARNASSSLPQRQHVPVSSAEQYVLQKSVINCTIATWVLPSSKTLSGVATVLSVWYTSEIDLKDYGALCVHKLSTADASHDLIEGYLRHVLVKRVTVCLVQNRVTAGLLDG
uniref:Uncharacterized protein n=1 Tax=Peronospora matthiolae TaxID=2874970 RepID=A0AAV1TLH4_9STRA